MQFERVENGDINLRVASQGEGPVILCVHGWPELWYSWRHPHCAGRQPVGAAGSLGGRESGIRALDSLRAICVYSQVAYSKMARRIKILDSKPHALSV